MIPQLSFKRTTMVFAASSTIISSGEILDRSWAYSIYIDGYDTALILNLTCAFLDKVLHYNDVIMSAMTSLTIVYSTVYSGIDKKNTSKLRVIGLCEGNSPVTGEFPTKGPVTRKMFPFDDVIMNHESEYPIENAYVYMGNDDLRQPRPQLFESWRHEPFLVWTHILFE